MNRAFMSRVYGTRIARNVVSVAKASPQMNMDRRALETFGGRLTLGDRLDVARVLGRPDTCEIAGAWTVLRYERWGLVLEFEEQQLFSVEFLIRDRDPAGELEAVEPVGPDVGRLTSKTTQAELVQRFGPPEKDEDGSDVGALFYTRPPMVLCYVLDGSQRLVSWKVSANI